MDRGVEGVGWEGRGDGKEELVLNEGGISVLADENDVDGGCDGYLIPRTVPLERVKVVNCVLCVFIPTKEQHFQKK